MTIKDLILLMWRNFRYIALGLVVGAGLGVGASAFQPPVYEATTKVFVSRPRVQSNSDMLSLSDEQFLAINLQLAKSPSVLSEASSQVGGKIASDNIQVGAVPNSLIIQIKVQDNDPQRAALIANALVETLIKQNNELLAGRYAGFENAITAQIDAAQEQIINLQAQVNQLNNEGIQNQLTQVNQQIEQLNLEISAIEQEIAGKSQSLAPLDLVAVAEKQSRLDQLHSLMTLYRQIQTNLTYIGKPGQSGLELENLQLAALQSTLDLYQQIHLNLINNRENVRLIRMQNTQNVMRIVSAIPPKNPVRPMPALYILLGGVAGFSIVVTAILTIDHLDDSLKSERQIEKLLEIPVLGSVFEGRQADKKLIMSQDIRSVEAEAFCALGASVEILCAGKNIHSLMIVSAEPADVKTAVAANLAILNAQQGRQVILLDGDVRHPYLHNLFGLENQKGFADLLSDRVDIKTARRAVDGVSGLALISGGIAEKESATWLEMKKWKQLLQEFQKQSDLVIVDGPPVNVADTQMLASKVHAVLLVIRSGHTRSDSVLAALKKLQLAGSRVIGVALYHQEQARGINILPRWPAKNKQNATQDIPADSDTITDDAPAVLP
ncbi:MAG: polysaccharide biosynthesis tyrosine autokinase [Chloroflexi bacterium]|nr:polysaccharide biosynthesis tyrosine autokinase [Chloroflexota bacterium]